MRIIHFAVVVGLAAVLSCFTAPVFASGTYTKVTSALRRPAGYYCLGSATLDPVARTCTLVNAPCADPKVVINGACVFAPDPGTCGDAYAWNPVEPPNGQCVKRINCPPGSTADITQSQCTDANGNQVEPLPDSPAGNGPADLNALAALFDAASIIAAIFAVAVLVVALYVIFRAFHMVRRAVHRS